jgi:hypothetical protein
VRKLEYFLGEKEEKQRKINETDIKSRMYGTK